MANETLNIVVEAKDNTRHGLNSAERSLGGFGKAAMGILQGVGLGAGKMLFDGIVGGIQKAAGVLPQLMMEGAQLQSVENTFQNLAKSIGTTADAMIRELRPAARGMVSDADLMQAANKFMSMGLADTAEEAAGLTEMATQLAVAMGKDATWGMESFALMLANQSIERLDEFGISSGRVRQRVDELMEATEGLTREEAFKMAVFEEGAVAMDRVGEQGDNAAGAIGRLRSAFENIRDAIALAAVPFVDEFAPVIQEFVDENAPKLFEKLGELSEYLFGRPATFIDPATMVDPGQIGVVQKWADELRRILTGISAGDWEGLLPDIETWGPDESELARFGFSVGEAVIDALGAMLGAESTSNTLAVQLGRAIARIPAKISWVLWGIGAAMSLKIAEGLGKEVTPAMEEALLDAGYLGTGKAVIAGEAESLANIAPPWAEQVAGHVRGTYEEYESRWPGSLAELLEILMPTPERTYAPMEDEIQRYSTGKYPLGGESRKGDYPLGYSWQEQLLTGESGRALPMADLEVEVYPKAVNQAEWQKRGYEAMTEWKKGAEAAAKEAGRLGNQVLLNAARAYGVR